MLGSARASRGSLRLAALFKDYIILPVEEYAQLKKVRWKVGGWMGEWMGREWGKQEGERR